MRNLPAFLFVAAIAFADRCCRGRGSAAERFLAWILLLPIGVTGALGWHLALSFFPATAAAHIGWQSKPLPIRSWNSADLAIGVDSLYRVLARSCRSRQPPFAQYPYSCSAMR